jgi:hypothetical protein
MAKGSRVEWKGVIFEGFTDKEIEAYGCKKKREAHKDVSVRDEVIAEAKRKDPNWGKHRA